MRWMAFFTASRVFPVHLCMISRAVSPPHSAYTAAKSSRREPILPADVPAVPAVPDWERTLRGCLLAFSDAITGTCWATIRNAGALPRLNSYPEQDVASRIMSPDARVHEERGGRKHREVIA